MVNLTGTILPLKAIGAYKRPYGLQMFIVLFRVLVKIKGFYGVGKELFEVGGGQKTGLSVE
jgi:hypothetical protein